jgi:glycosyltransferase involved in cell wall biosynthesis
MNILHIISGGETGGSKVHLLNLCRSINKRGIRATIVCFIEGELYREAAASGIDIILLEQRRRNDLKVIDSILRIISQKDIDLIHSHGGRANFVCYYLKRKCHLPFLTTIHSDYASDYKGNLLKSAVFSRINRYVLRYFDGYIAISDDFKEMLIKRGFIPRKIHVVYNGMDFQQERCYMDRRGFSEKYEIKINEEDNVVTMIARLHPIKGHKVFFDACKIVLKQNSNVKFIVAGDGQLGSELHEYARELGISDNVIFTGWVDDSLDILYNSEISILASYSESFPFVLLESALVKTPVIATEVGGVNRLVINGETGYLVKPGDSKRLAECMNLLINDTRLRERMGQQLYNRARNNFSLEFMADSVIDVYRNLIGRETTGKKEPQE